MGPTNKLGKEAEEAALKSPVGFKPTKARSAADLAATVLILGGLAIVLPISLIFLLPALSGEWWSGPLPLQERIGYGAIGVLGPVVLMVVIIKVLASGDESSSK